MTELLPCPFCGSKDVEQDPGSDFVMCNGCNGAAKAKMWNTRQSSEWVSVEDRLPDNRIEVLAWNTISGVEICRLNKEMNRWDVPWTATGSSMSTVTHWMPLPQPPITESKDGQ